MKYILFAAVCTIVLTVLLPACQAVYDRHGPRYSRDGMTLIGVFDGVLPCADCAGIDTEVVLWMTSPTDESQGWFRLTETYQGKPEPGNQYAQEGAWKREDKDGEAVYVLDMGDGTTRAYARDDKNTLTMLSTDGHQRMESSMNYSLTRVK